MVLAVMTCRLINNFKQPTTMNVNKCQMETICCLLSKVSYIHLQSSKFFVATVITLYIY